MAKKSPRQQKAKVRKSLKRSCKYLRSFMTPSRLYLIGKRKRINTKTNRQSWWTQDSSISKTNTITIQLRIPDVTTPERAPNRLISHRLLASVRPARDSARSSMKSAKEWLHKKTTATKELLVVVGQALSSTKSCKQMYWIPRPRFSSIMTAIVLSLLRI